MNCSQEISRSRKRSACSASSSSPTGPRRTGRPTNRPLAARGWWVRVSVAAALAMETSLTMLASAAASAAAWLADLSSSTSTLGFAVMTQSCQVGGEGVLPVHRCVGETEPFVGAPGGGVVAVDVELDLGQPEPGEVRQAEPGDRPAEPPALVRRVHPDHVHLPGPVPDSVRPERGPALTSASSTLVQWKATTCAGGVVDDEQQPGRVEPRLGHPLVQVGDGQPALFRMPGERRRVEPPPRPRRRVPARTPAPRTPAAARGSDGIRVGERARHQVQAAGHLQPGRARQGVGGREHPVRPHAAGALGEGRVEQRPAVAAAAARRVDHQLGDGIRRARRGDLGVADHGAVVGAPQQVHDPVAGRADGQPERLGDRPDPVGLGGARPQRRAGARMPWARRPRGRARCAPPQASSSEKESATSGTNR